MGSSSFDFSDETVLITGASSGIGRAVALAFADADATVVNASRRPVAKDEGAELPTHERIQADRGEAAFVETDVRYPDQLREAVEFCHEYGGVDIYVNNAGIHIIDSLLDITEDQFNRIHEINVKGYFFGTQAAAQDMIDRGVEGNIVNMASVSSTMAKPEQIAYESTKGAIRMITLSSAIELAEEGIRVNAIAPGRIATEFTEMSAQEMRDSVTEGDLMKPIPLRRSGVPDDVTGATLFIASEDASYVTGELFYVDGGFQIA
ncbi:SDR family NAD(P)-dependent oxidoreductase [Halocatena marina]|uniref:SDR family NAD(P)-dependent oxidoreductase n=1 Tax=Halocatena marina TaxID=2934937 RepID=A0ABD5YXF1_9EURY|nr:SDR family oxidoreductase [Halocatena marina]